MMMRLSSANQQRHRWSSTPPDHCINTLDYFSFCSRHVLVLIQWVSQSCINIDCRDGGTPAGAECTLQGHITHATLTRAGVRLSIRFATYLATQRRYGCTRHNGGAKRRLSAADRTVNPVPPTLSRSLFLQVSVGHQHTRRTELLLANRSQDLSYFLADPL